MKLLLKLPIIESDITRSFAKAKIEELSDKHKAKILLHKPHPRKELLEYQIKQLIDLLEQEGLI